MPDDAGEKREKARQKTEENRKLFEDTRRKRKAQLDRTHMSSAARKPLEKAFAKLIRQCAPLLDELNEADQE